ncbi:hypothetical protein [Marinobacter sp. DY40_1A1]|uniref:hypothetical protein n=1 Tax=Marinobacter sp. DY40_1A1 TaxID=2583229 RepID=UPI0019030684|nr:hypothetical protein [Marinobacter sp. DY40_1A1]MBK1887776.1 hypothetical protein [Marinobacter sp. DY40_1A1]
MEEHNRYQQAISNLQAYLNSASIAVFLMSIGTLIAAYSPLNLISPEVIASVSGQSGLMFVLPLDAALVMSGIHLSTMWSEHTQPSPRDFLLFVTLHLSALLVCYFAVEIVLPTFQSDAVPIVCVLIAIALPCVLFLRTRST